MSLLLALVGGGGTAYTLNGDAGSYSISGQDATFAVTRNLAGDAGAYSIAGQDATFAVTRNLAGDAGAYTISGQDAAFAVTRNLVGDAGAYSITGQDATFLKLRVMDGDAGAYVLVGEPATFVVTPGALVPAGGSSGWILTPGKKKKKEPEKPLEPETFVFTQDKVFPSKPHFDPAPGAIAKQAVDAYNTAVQKTRDRTRRDEEELLLM